MSALVAPEPNVISLITDWLSESGVLVSQITVNPSGDFLIARGIPAHTVSTLFKCDLQLFSHKQSPRIAQVCSSGYTLPENISKVVDFVGGLMYFPSK